VLSVTRHQVPAEQTETFLLRARDALDTLRARPGFQHGTVGRATDDPTLFVLVTAWADVGSWRRALSGYDVRVAAVPLLATAIDDANAYESLLLATPGELQEQGSDRARDADVVQRGVAWEEDDRG
jgi:heme oxygenase (mycobilin-producing)